MNVERRLIAARFHVCVRSYVLVHGEECLRHGNADDVENLNGERRGDAEAPMRLRGVVVRDDARDASFRAVLLAWSVER
jgi:hypothetical protein